MTAAVFPSAPQSPTEYVRNVTFPATAFDRLKKFQRNHAEQHGTELSNSEALTMILEEHERLLGVVSILPESLRNPLALRCEELLVSLRSRESRQK